MVRYMAEKQIKHLKELQAFERLGYRFSPQRSDETTYVFLKHNQTDDVWTIGVCSPEHQRYRAECNSFQREPSSWTGEIPVPNHPKTSPKGQKKVSKARKEKRKEKRHSDPKGSFFYCKHGENHSPCCRTNPQNQRGNSDFAPEKRIIRFAWGTIRGDAGSQHANAPNRVPKLHLRQKIWCSERERLCAFLFQNCGNGCWFVL